VKKILSLLLMLLFLNGCLYWTVIQGVWTATMTYVGFKEDIERIKELKEKKRRKEVGEQKNVT